MGSRPGIPRPRALTRVLRAVRSVHFDVAPSQSARPLAVRSGARYRDGNRVRAARLPIVCYLHGEVHRAGTGGAGARKETRAAGSERANGGRMDDQLGVVAEG